jgi:hypothetical protein
MRARIMQGLRDIEAQHDVTVLFADEAATSPRRPGIHAFIESELAANAAEQVTPMTPMTPLASSGGAGLDAFLCETVLRFDEGAAGVARTPTEVL